MGGGAKRETHTPLTEQFGIPPFSVLDARAGYWIKRKKKWLETGIESNKGRERDLAFDIGGDFDYLKGFDTQTSVFDPVLCEMMYKWFCTDGGTVFDCFAGGCVRGVIAELLGLKYKGIDLRPEQIAENQKQAQEIGVAPEWYCDDSLNADKYIEDESADMLFTCPPYADLEKYSDDARDISNMSYKKFCEVYAEILGIACRKLKKDRFAVVVIGDVRDSTGAYRGLVEYTKEVLKGNGLKLYNDMVLIEPIGTAAIRAPKQFKAGRKTVKTHQCVLCYYKGNIKAIKGNYGDVVIDNIDGENNEW